jgi:cobalt-zinc-cadmium efflux system outer membrane protein
MQTNKFTGSLIPILALAFVTSARAEPARPDRPAPLGAVVRAALANNPALQAARSRLRAADQRIPQSAAWEDPQLGVESETMTEPEGTRFNALKIMAGQQLPISGRNRVMARTAAAEAESESHRVREMELETAARTAATYYALATADSLLSITGRSRSLLEETERIAKTRYESGQGALADLLAVQTETAELDRMRIEFEQQRAVAAAELSALLGLSASAPAPRPEPLAFRDMPATARLVDHALQHRPAIAAAQSDIGAARQREVLSRRNRIPDPMIEVGAKDYQDTDSQEWTATVTFRLPWWNQGRLRAADAEARALREAGEYQLASLEQETRSMVRSRLAKAEAVSRQWKLVQDRILPLARKTVESVRAGYETGTAGFAQLNMARTRLQESEQASARLLAEYLETVAMLESASGMMPGVKETR